jgi:serine protease AprX
MAFAPGNDPFVITVGATDTEGSVSANDDFAAPWSAFGYTLDGFLKPDIGAPGRYLIGPVPTTSTLYSERPDRVVAPGYMQISGTSFAAPVVAGAAAYLLALHPTWTPDQVKGALMLTAKPTPAAVPLSAGVGEVNAARAADVVDPPNPNAALAPFVVPDPNGGPLPVFDAPVWQGAALADANWSTANWSTANWSTANWSTANWSTANWSTANWSTANWSTANWADGGDTFGSDANWADSAQGDFLADGGYWISDADLAAALAEYGETP